MEVVDEDVSAGAARRKSTLVGDRPPESAPALRRRAYDPLAGAAETREHAGDHELPSPSSADGPESPLAPVVAVAQVTHTADDGARFREDASDIHSAEEPARPPRPTAVPAELVHRAVSSPVPERQPARTPAVEPPVRIHIGRLEVRAVLPDPPRAPRPRERLAPDGLSLADYLRGRRDAR
jgi:hypothetical protein